MAKFNLICLFLLVSTFYKDVDSQSESTENLNNAVDQLIRELGREHSADSPVEIEYKGTSYEKRYGPLMFSYEIAMKDIKVLGLCTSMRRKDNVVRYDYSNGDRMLRFNVMIGPVDFTLEGIVSVVGITNKYDWEGRVAYIEASIGANYWKKSDQLQINYVIVENVQGIKVNVDGMRSISFINALRNALLNQAGAIFSNLFKAPTASVLEEELKVKLISFEPLKEILRS